jgi:hypothetical protein
MPWLTGPGSPLRCVRDDDGEGSLKAAISSAFVFQRWSFLLLRPSGISLSALRFHPQGKKKPGQKTRQLFLIFHSVENHLPEGNSWLNWRRWEESATPQNQQ